MMNACVLNRILPSVLLLSTLPGLHRSAFAQTSETPIVTIVASDYHAAEAEQEVGFFTVSRTGPTEASLLVFYELSGTARDGVDYQELPLSVTIPAGAVSALITVKPIDDSLVEGTETVVATLVPSPTLSPIEPYRVGFPYSDVLLLADNDSPTTNSPPSVRILGPTNSAIFLAPATIRLVAHAEPISQVRSVEFFAGTTSLGLATFEPTKCSVCPVWVLEWTNVLAGEYTLTAQATDELGASAVSEPVKISVRNSPVKPVVNIEATDPLASEIPEVPPGMGLPQRYDPAIFTVRRTGATDAALEVRYRIEGTAVNGVDYAKLSGVVRIPAGFALATIEVDPIDDGAVEGTETVVVILLPNDCDASPPPPGCYAVGEHSQATALIFDNDTVPHSPPTVAIVGPTDGALFVAPARIEITATAQASGAWIRAVEFFAGDRSLGVVQFSATSDSFRLIWENVPSGAYTLTAKATDSLGATAWSSPIHITVKALPVVNIEATDAEAAEISPLLGVPPNPAVFKITRTGETSRALRVYYRLTGTAKNGVDYQELPGSVTIPEGAASTEIVVQPIDDALVEGKESVVATLVPLFLIDPAIGSDPYAVGLNAHAEAHILDNDEPPPNALPVVKIALPVGGSTFPAPAAINIVVEVRDPDGWVGLVEFFANDRKIGEQSVVFIRQPDPGQVQSFSFDWKEVPQGEYTLVARATDNRAGKAASDPVRVRVGEATPLVPVVTIYARDAFAREGTNSSNQWSIPI